MTTQRLGGVLDTNTIIQLHAITPADLPSRPRVTTVTIAELAVGPLIADTDVDRAIRQAHLQFAESIPDPLPLDVRAAHAFGHVAASIRRSGRTHKARRYDALIAAIAIANGLPVYTCNAADFDGIDELEIIAVTPATHA